MQSWFAKPSFWLSLMLVSGAADAATEAGMVTLVEGTPRLMRGPTWYKVAAGTRVEEGDIVEAPERAQVQLEFTAGTAANLVGPGTIYVMPVKAGPPVLTVPNGWLKVATRPPGVRVHTAPFDLVTADGIVVMRVQGPVVDFFVEAGSAKLIELSATGADGPSRDVKRGEYWAKPTAASPLTSVPRAPAPFVDAMPRHFADLLPMLAASIKSKPALVVDHEVTFAEAEPWLAGRDRAVFERRFVSRLRDPAFRKAVEPTIARYPSWDRMLHPEKYAPKPAPANTPAPPK
jgi:hypothetical protein